MNTQWWLKELLINDLSWTTQLSEHEIEKVANSILNKLSQRRYVALPRYLGDEMYEHQRFIDPTLTYDQANRLYVAAIAGYESIKQPVLEEEHEGFW